MSLNAAEVTTTATPGSIAMPSVISAGPLGSSGSPPQLVSPTVISTNASITPIQQALVWTCLAIVKEHQKGNITHSQATVQVFSVLPDNKFGSKAFISYVEQLSQTERDRLVAVTCGTTTLLAPSVATPTHSMAATFSALSNSPVEVQSGTSTQAAANLKQPADQLSAPETRG